MLHIIYVFGLQGFEYRREMIKQKDSYISIYDDENIVYLKLKYL